MNSMIPKSDKINSKERKTEDSFSDYLEKQCTKTTVNEQKIKSFSWYQKILGLK